MVVVGWILLGFGIVRLGVAAFNLASKPYLPAGKPKRRRKKVSVLVPARNEERNIERLLGNFSAWRNEVHELIIYDDMSTDRTFEVACGYTSGSNKIKVVRGSGLPEGWLGKNHACHRLSLMASGDILLFVDADVTMDKGAVDRSVKYMDKFAVRLLFIFPTQIIDNPGSRLTVPLMNWILLTLLPLPAVKESPRPSLSAANGQFMMFDKSVYGKLEPHSRLRMSAAEDIAIVKFYKEEGMNIATLLGDGKVCCRMYNDLKEAVGGFSKNIFYFFGGHIPLSFLFILTTTVAPFWIFFFNGAAAGLSYLFVIIAIRIIVSVASRQNVPLNVLLIIPQHLMLWIITVKAAINRHNKNLTWKGRNIY